METYNDAVTRTVLDYLYATRQGHHAIADALNVTTMAVSRKLRNQRAWSLADLQTMHEKLGIEVPLPAMSRPSKDLVETRPAPVAVTR